MNNKRNALMNIKIKLSLIVIFMISSGWGFFGHENINRLAVFTLPAEMNLFYKKNIHYIVEASVNPDKRRYAVPEEGPRHYIDLDGYCAKDTLRKEKGYAEELPKYWSEALKELGQDTLMSHGIVPWHTYAMFLRLKEAFLLGDPDKILRISSELGHYVADAHVPLHTTSNHNGQKTDQHGIHGLWESRLPELFSGDYDFFVGRATYIGDVQQAMWDVVKGSHACVDSVLSFEKELSARELSKKYSFETRAKQTVKVYSYRYSKLYHNMLPGMVERRMRNSIKMVGNLWYTAWVDAGQPDLIKLINHKPSEEELLKRKEEFQMIYTEH
ncbi:MAG: zinc dependent phospholipase C family protein [Bacteroidota bacterium]